MPDVNILSKESKRFLLDGEILVGINISGNLFYANLEGFDTFTFITKENKLLKNTDLVFYNNLKDERAIVTEKTEWETENNDIELNINFKDNNFNSEVIEIYLQLVYYPKPTSVFDFFRIKKE